MKAFVQPSCLIEEGKQPVQFRRQPFQVFWEGRWRRVGVRIRESAGTKIYTYLVPLKDDVEVFVTIQP